MDKGQKHIVTETHIKEILSMAFLKGMDNTDGLMIHSLREILSKEPETGMACGKVQEGKMGKYTRDITCWIKSMGMEYMIGEMATFTKDFG